MCCALDEARLGVGLKSGSPLWSSSWALWALQDSSMAPSQLFMVSTSSDALTSANWLDLVFAHLLFCEFLLFPPGTWVFLRWSLQDIDQVCETNRTHLELVVALLPRSRTCAAWIWVHQKRAILCGCSGGFLPAPQQKSRCWRLQDARAPCDQKSQANGEFLCD